jgi:DNA primase small subunit
MIGCTINCDIFQTSHHFIAFTFQVAVQALQLLSGYLHGICLKPILIYWYMGRFVGEVDREFSFMKHCFERYYRREPVIPPYRFTRREWGFFPFGGKMMFRHIAFQKREELFSFFRDSPPMHAYYSVAYYGDPGLQPMGEKFRTWMGADLIFDLDADHLPDADKMTYPEQLAEVKEEVKRLLFEFILGDLGLPEEQTFLHFSGGRGYHIHVRSPEVLKMDSRDRRQIVDYITGRGLDLDVIAPERVVSLNRYFGSEKRRRHFPERSHGGWVERIHDGKKELITRLEGKEKKEQIRILSDIARTGKVRIGESGLKTIVEKLFWEGEGRSAERLKGSDLFDVFPRPQQLDTFIQIVIAYASVKLSGETDEPVTTDIKRLIRCPGSLHGKTGLKVMKIEKERDAINSFDPLKDAVVLADDGINLTMKEDFQMSMGGQFWKLDQGPVNVPRYLAYFLVARGKALIS